jgi:ankyrin repeat protein
MKYKLALILCILGFAPLINAMNLSRSPNFTDVGTAAMSTEGKKVFDLIKEDKVKHIENQLVNKMVSPNAIVLGKSILYWAIYYNRLNIVKALIEYGAEVQPNDIQIAEEKGFNDIAQILKDAQEIR